VLIPNHHEAYVSQEEFDDIQKIIDRTRNPFVRGRARQRTAGHCSLG
jgi:hypothetical protein